MGNASSINLKSGSSLELKKLSVKEKDFDIKLNNNYEYTDYTESVDKYNDLAEDFINVTGDINGDGKVTIKDKSLLEKYINDGTILNEYDVNGDGFTNALDVKTIESYLINDDALHSYFDLNDLSKPEKVHSVDNLNNMLDSIEKSIKEAKEKKNELENSIWWDKTIQGNFDFLFHDGNRELRISQTELEISKLEEEISFLNSLKNQTETSIKLQPFDEIKASYEFQKYYREHKDDEINIMFEYGAVQDEVNPYERDVNQYLTQEQKVLYQFLLEKEGKTKSSGKAAEYLDALKDSVNQVKGAKLADEYLSSLNLDDEGKVKEDLWNIFCTSGQGLGDGIRTFHEGIKNIIDNGDTLTAEDYKKMIILQYLSENSDILEGTYEFSSSFGNMVPSLVASAIVSYVATPAAGSVVGSVLMGASAGGNAKHQALVKGNSVEASTLYGIFSGTSEAVLGYYLGKIPGISKMSGLTLGNLLSEGAEEYLQEWVDAGLQAVILGEDVDWHDVPKNAEKSFIMGILMAGFMNGGQKLVEVTINGVKRKINVEQTIDYMSKHPNATAEELVNLTEKQSNTNDIEARPKLADTLAEKTYNAAFSHEKKVTNSMKSLQDNNSELVGLDFRLKTQESLARKIYSDSLADNISLEEAASGISDSLRYTLCIDPANYASKVTESLTKLESEGYKVTKFKNFWGGELYQGINVQLEAPDGFKIELQFHTKDSFHTKEVLNHKYYEIARSDSATVEEKAKANEIMKYNQSLVKTPEGASNLDWRK